MGENNILIYQDENGVTKVDVRFSDEDIWLTQQQVAEPYDTTQQNISQHIDGIYKDKELNREATNKKFLLVRTEGSRQVKRNIYQQVTDIYATATDYDPRSDLTRAFWRLFCRISGIGADSNVYESLD